MVFNLFGLMMCFIPFLCPLSVVENYYYTIASLDHVVYSGLCHGLQLVATTIVSRNMTKHAAILGKIIYVIMS